MPDWRRPALSICTLLLAGLALLLAKECQAGNRLTLNFNSDWRFIKEDPAGAAEPVFDDSSWAVVSAPHTFNDTDTFTHWSVPGHVGETNQWTGRTWYRKSFTLPDSAKGKNVYLEFEAVRQVAEVYLNGLPLGTNRTGFIPFGFDLTPLLKWNGATNVLAVMADNRFTQETEMARIAATELPWNSPHWHPAHGGIYRNVYLHITDPLHISLPLYSNLKTTGPYLYSTDISTNSAQVHCELPVQNGRSSGAHISARVEVFDHDGKSVLVLTSKRVIPSCGHEILQLSGSLNSPQLWEPDFPYLYKAVCSLAEDGQTLDSCEVPFGIRFVRWDARTGFYINGHHLKLHGWGQRPTSEWPGLGAAQPDWMHYYTLQLMKDAGGNFVRWGHCAGAPADIASSDQLGMVVLQPGVDGEGDAHGDAWGLRASAFRDMLVYYRNHPSILIWEGGNQKVAHDHAAQLKELVQTYDPHGGRAYAHRRADETTGEFMDVDIGTEGDRQIPRLPVVEGEYDREESPRRVWDNFSPPNFGYPEAKGQTYQLTSEQFAVNEVTEFVHKIAKPYSCGGANWIFSDTTSGGRVSCEVARAGGEVDGVRLPKEAYYVCQTLFRNDPQIHIIGHWTYPANTRKTVYVTSNCGDVELFLNGKSLGHGQLSDFYLFTFPNVAWEPGELRAVGYTHGKPATSDTRHTVGPPVAVRLTPLLGPKGLQADGSDVALLDVEAVDAHGDRCPTFQQRVDFALTGPGIWRGGYNSGKTNSINNPFLNVECGVNRVSIRSTLVPGPITVAARCPGLEPASITLNSQPVSAEHGFTANLPPLPSPPSLARTVLDDFQNPVEVETKIDTGRFLATFSYSGPAGSVSVKQNARDGMQVYSDRDFLFSGLPAILQGSDWVQTANADKLYSAVDLVDLAMNGDGVVYIAHDPRLPRPDWLVRQFLHTSSILKINRQDMEIFERRVHSGESLTLGSNTEDRHLKSCNMYVVFVKRDDTSSASSFHASREADLSHRD
jgi:beta-galactosidase